MNLPASAPLRILWIVKGIRRDAQEGWTAVLASNRYRVIIPARHLVAAGHHVDFVQASECQWPPAVRPDVVFIGKIVPNSQDDQDGVFRSVGARMLKVAEAAVASGVPVVADFNDDHFEHELKGPYWRSLAQVASACIVGSDAMGKLLGKYTQRPILTVGDPIGSPRNEPRVFNKPTLLHRMASGLLNRSRGGERLKLAWYGTPTNFGAMRDWAEKLAPLARQQRWVLRIVTIAQPDVGQFIQQFNSRHEPDAVCELVPWSEQDQWNVVRDSHIVLLPADLADPRKSVKTSNRLVDALHAGRYVIASAVPSYLPFERFVTITQDPLQACRDYLASPGKHLDRIVQGQKEAVATSSGEAVAHAWLDAIGRAIEPGTATSSARASIAAAAPALAQTAAPQARSGEPVRLNLGCGDKILPGYVNVDVVASRRGHAPDVLCDLHDLSPAFADGHVDEVMAVRVVEHFWRWEIDDVLREWVRVLKPGGRMILESSDLTSACETFLRDPEKFAQPDQSGQQTMWVFYGDPALKDPHMIHRWGYTPSSLARLMESVGLVNVRQDPAQNKMHDPSDMRLVGEKPLS